MLPPDVIYNVSQVHPITAAEIEISLFAYEEETKKVIATGKELGITIFGYSPVGRGMLTGNFNNPEDINIIMKFTPRFRGDLFEHNIKLVHAVKKVAEKKGVTLPQLAIAWVGNLGPHVVPLPGSSNTKRTLENLAAGSIVFSGDELKEINEIIENFEVKGGRYPEEHSHLLWG